MDEVKEHYKKYTGNYVKVTSNSEFNVGILIQADSNFICLNPSLINETIELGNDKLELRLEEKLPTTIHYQYVTSISPISKDYFESLLIEYPIKNPKVKKQLNLF